jgi:transcriptional regulator of acetoin/glycerol metabolism
MSERSEETSRKNKFELEIDLDRPPGPKQFTRLYLEWYLSLFDGNRSQAAKRLGVSRTTLYRHNLHLSPKKGSGA